jgi:uncharacterized protein YbjT (DUF2867 family)
MTILVTAATGTVGRHVVRALIERGAPVRAFVRDPGRAAHLLGPDVEMAAGDLADPASVRQAMSGVDRLFLACGNVPGQVELENAAIDAAAAAGVRRVVKLSGPDADVDSPLIFERWHGEIERHLAAAGLPAIRLRPRTYMTNLMAYAGSIAQTGMLFAPAGTAAISFIDPRDVAGVAAGALLGAGQEGRAYTLTGPEAIGQPVGYVAVGDDDARRAMIGDGLPPMVADAIVAIFASQRAGSMADTTDAVRELTGRGPRSIADFAREVFAPAMAGRMPVGS